MVIFGLVSSFFDFLTFGTLLFLFRATPEQFRSGWFVESLLTELLVAMVVRTRRPFYQSKPGRWLWISTLIVSLLTLAIPYLPLSPVLGFVSLSFPLFTLLIAITILYVIVTEIAKQIFYQRVTN
jgi:Mg2+-importing ATPase